MGFGYIALGIVFLFNPNVYLIDILPDFIGYLLIYHGLFRMSFLADNLRETRGWVWRLFIVTFVRALMTFFPHTSQVYALLYTFVFGVLELLWFLPAVKCFFDGLYSLGMRLGSDSVYGIRRNSEQGEKKKENAESSGRYAVPMDRLKFGTIVFFLIKTAASVLPETVSLEVQDTFEAAQQAKMPLSAFKPIFYVVAVAVVFGFGIFWLVRMERYLGGMRRDKGLNEGIRAYYDEKIARDDGLMAAIRMKRAMLLAFMAAITSVFFILDGLCVVPSCVAAAFAAFVFAEFFRYDKKLSVAGWILSAAAAGLSVWNFMRQIPYFDEYDAVAARYLSRAIALYRPIRFWATAENVVMLLLFTLLFIVFVRLVRRHTELLPFSDSSPAFHAETRRAEIRHAINVRAVGAAAVGVLYFILRAVYYSVAMYYPAFWLVCIFAYIVWLVCVFRTMTAAQDELYERLELKY